MAPTRLMTRDFSEEDKVPYFLWDRGVTVAELRAVLAAPGHPQRIPLLRAMLREARPDDVWRFVDPQAILDEWTDLTPGLGKRREFWQWLLESWKRMGYFD